jgi:hypothetical protein
MAPAAVSPKALQMPIRAHSRMRALDARSSPGRAGSGNVIAATRRALSMYPVMLSVGIRTAATRRAGLQARYHSLARSQKCRPIIAWSHTTTSRRDWLGVRSGHRIRRFVV